MNRRLFSLGILVVITLTLSFYGCKKRQEKLHPQKVLIMVLDTSASMAGKGGKSNILPEVKESIKDFISKLRKGDVMYLIVFDENVVKYKPVKITDENSKKILEEYITKLRARGKWTYTAEAIRTLFKTAKEAEKKYPKYMIQIIVITDGIDDPPPDKRNDRLNINLVGKYKGNKWYIYYVALRELDKNLAPILKKAVKNKEQLKIIAKKHIKEAQIEIEKDFSKKEKAEAKKLQAKETLITIIYIIAAILIIGIILFILFIIMRLLGERGLRLTGEIEYWHKDVVRPIKESKKLSTFLKNCISIGKAPKNDIRISDLETENEFSICAKYRKLLSFKKDYKIIIKVEKAEEFEFIEQKIPGELTPGDTFRFANYLFTYK